MINDYREQLDSYQNVDVYIRKGLFGKVSAKVYLNGQKPYLEWVRSFSNIFINANVAFSDDVKTITVNNKEFKIDSASVIF